jgi:hypothetical protein
MKRTNKKPKRAKMTENSKVKEKEEEVHQTQTSSQNNLKALTLIKSLRNILR